MQLDELLSQLPSLTIDALCIVRRESSGDQSEFVWVNRAICELCRRSREELLGQSPTELLHHPEYVDDFIGNLEEAISTGRNRIETDTKCIRGDGTEFWANVNATVFPTEEGGRMAIVSVRDIDLLKTREQSAELALIENECLLSQVEAARSQLSGAINAAPDAFAIFDKAGWLVNWNPAFAVFATRDPAGLKPGMSYRDVAQLLADAGAIDDDAESEVDWSRVLDPTWTSTEQSEMILSSGGLHYRVTRTVTPNGDRVLHCVDISDFLQQQCKLQSYAAQLEAANNEIRQQALNDELTQLGNRRFLNAKLGEWTERRRVSGGEIAALHIDLDRFKQINDTLGHAAGDQVLRTVAERLNACVRDDDVVARTGGDEFVVLFACEADSDAPERLAERLVDELSQPVTINGRPCLMGASVGLARTPTVKADDLLSSSDVALYKAKSGGRSMVATFDAVDLEELKASKLLGDDLVRGIGAAEFVPVYQPQVDPGSDRVVALEVLARWQHPERGLLTPDMFLPAANELRVDGEIDRLIFRKAIEEACSLLRGLPVPPSLSFNVGLSRLMGGCILDDVERQDYPGGIAFELLETIFLEEESAEFIERIEALRNIGVSLEVDDFGSGRASIVGLRRIRPDRLKIDRRLVEPVATSESSRKLARSIIEIGHALDICVTAEGIETREQADVMRDLGCDRLQGYLYSRPVPLAETPGLFLPSPRAAGVR